MVPPTAWRTMWRNQIYQAPDGNRYKHYKSYAVARWFCHSLALLLSATAAAWWTCLTIRFVQKIGNVETR